MKSEMTKTRLRRRTVAAARCSIAARSVVRPSVPAAAGLVSSAVRYRMWVRPVRGGMIRWYPLSYRIAPTRLPVRLNSRPRQTASSASTESFPVTPNRIDADRSRTSQAVSSRSSVYSRTYGSSRRAVTFQSMCRTSSSGVYSRRSVKSIPAPRNTVR